MPRSTSLRPVVLVLAGHDPTGGAGIQADIETLASFGCHAAPVITSLTAQNTGGVAEYLPQNPVHFQRQIELLLNDVDIAACKIGLCGSPALVHAIARALRQLPRVPLVIDPVLVSGTGQALADAGTEPALLEDLLPLATVATPNSEEARRLAHQPQLDSAAQSLLAAGCEYLLITGTHEPTAEVINTLYGKNQPAKKYRWQRLRGTFHGSGCTLSSAIAACLAAGDTVERAVERAQEYTWQTLKHGLHLGKAQQHPDRFFWRAAV